MASEAAVGGERWWDSRGGRGGVWTTEGEWLDAGDLCSPFGGDVFKDGDDFWGEEGRETVEEPKVRVVVVPPPAVEEDVKEESVAETQEFDDGGARDAQSSPPGVDEASD